MLEQAVIEMLWLREKLADKLAEVEGEVLADKLGDVEMEALHFP